MDYVVTYLCLGLILGPIVYAITIALVVPIAGLFATPATAQGPSASRAVNRNNKVYGSPNAKSYIRVRTHAYDYDED